MSLTHAAAAPGAVLTVELSIARRDNPAMRRLLLWGGTDEWRAECASVDLGSNGITATGTQLGADPLPYRADYELDAGDGFVTRSFLVEVTGEGWGRRIHLERDDGGGWSCDTDASGDVELSAPGCDAAALDGALDCDLGLSPLTNYMPVRRHRLHEGGRRSDFLMAWVSMPDLGLYASRQRYEHVRRDVHGAVVRYLDLGRHEGFTAELELDGDGFVVNYPGLAQRRGVGP